MAGDETSDPFEPVEGVTLERYTEFAVALPRADEDEIESLAGQHGIPPGRARAIGEEWDRRMRTHPEVVYRYHELYQRALRAAGIESPDITFEQYAEMLRRQQAGEPVGEVVSDYGLDLQTFAMVSQHWIERMAADPSLAMRLAQALGAGGPGPPG